ncbi:MAG: hypothetical protein OXC13_01180 [Caldilineaceae bacterium]|nr:hypothetical protein [Caldilineaceae bacterium]
MGAVLAATRQDGILAVGDKADRGSHDHARRVWPLHLVSAWADEARLVLGLRRVDDRPNASTAIPELPKTLAREAVSPPGAGRSAGTTGTCSGSCQISIRLPCRFPVGGQPAVCYIE